MKIMNIIWGFSLGAGIDKCFLTYDSLNTEDKDVSVFSVCINLLSHNSHIEPLVERGVRLIDIKNRFDFSWLNKLSKLIKSERPDVLFAHGFNGAIMMALLRFLKNVHVPIVCTYHGPYHAPSKAKKLIEPIYNGLSILIYKHLAKHTICVENFSRHYLNSKGVKHVMTVHNGIPDTDVKVISNRPGESEYIKLVTASRITEVKGLTYLLQALSILKERNIKFQYDMIGEGPLLDSLRNEAKSLGLDETDIRFQGFKTNIAEWMRQCDIFVLPSLFEYHSIAILEAMRSACAIIATDVGGNCESLTDKEEGIIVPPKNPMALANAIQYLAEHPELRARLSSNARHRFEEEFTERAMKRGIIKVLKL